MYIEKGNDVKRDLIQEICRCTEGYPPPFSYETIHKNKNVYSTRTSDVTIKLGTRDVEGGGEREIGFSWHKRGKVGG